MSQRTVKTCDSCSRELPLRGEKGQLVREVVKVRVFWKWPGRQDDEWEPEHICGECWDKMLAAVGGDPE